MSNITRLPLPPVAKGVVGTLTLGIVGVVALAATVGACGAMKAPAANTSESGASTSSAGYDTASAQDRTMEAGMAGGGAQDAEANLAAARQFLATNAKRKGVIVTASGLQYQVIKPGSGPKPTPADEVEVAYEGKLTDGRLFDASPKVSFPVSGVVPGFAEAVQLMSKGARYRVWLPPELAYGARSPDPATIPANAVLMFNLELLDFRSGGSSGR